MDNKFQDPLVVPKGNGYVNDGEANLSDKGTGTGFNDNTVLDGASVDTDATNGMGSFSSPSDPMDERFPRADPAVGGHAVEGE